MQSLKAGELELLRRAHRESEARRTAEAAAAAALQQLHRVQSSISMSDMPASSHASAGWGGVSQSLPRGAVDGGQVFEARRQQEANAQHMRPRTAPSAILQPHDLASSVIEFAMELGHTVVSPVVSSEVEGVVVGCACP